MAEFKCKMCGGALEITEGITVCTCEYCGTKQTVPNADNEKKINLFNRANRLRSACEFDKAASVYESIVAEFPEESEAYWGLCLCKYGIEYVDDPETAKKIPTCHRTCFDSIFDDDNFNLAQEYSDVVSKSMYRAEAKNIDMLQKSILEIANKEEPFDIFICYKESDENGERTKDSVMAQDIYDALTSKGYKVFFSRITLEDKLGQEYEPYIFSALNSAKIMLAVGTKYEYYNSVWVKNEWGRFLNLMKSDKEKVLIPCYADIDAYDMPQEFKNIQGQDMGKVGFLQDLVRGIEKIISNNMQANSVQTKDSKINPLDMQTRPLVNKAFRFLKESVNEEEINKSKEVRDKVNKCCQDALDIDPKCGHAHLIMLLLTIPVDLLNIWVREIDMIEDFIDEIEYLPRDILLEIDKSPYFEKAKKYGDEKTVKNLDRVRKIFEFRHIETIELPEGITEIADESFFNYESLTSIVIPESVTSIGACAFSNCKSLTSVIIPKSVTSIGDGAFEDCISLTSVIIPEGITSIGYSAFSGCTGLTSVIIPKSVISIGEYAFSNCKSLTSVIIPERVTSIEAETFSQCTNLTSVIIPEGVTSIEGSAFYNCESLTSVKIPNSVNLIRDGAFSSCSNLTVIISDSIDIIEEDAFGEQYQESCVKSICVPSKLYNEFCRKYGKDMVNVRLSEEKQLEESKKQEPTNATQQENLRYERHSNKLTGLMIGFFISLFLFALSNIQKNILGIISGIGFSIVYDISSIFSVICIALSILFCAVLVTMPFNKDKLTMALIIALACCYVVFLIENVVGIISGDVGADFCIAMIFTAVEYIIIIISLLLIRKKNKSIITLVIMLLLPLLLEVFYCIIFDKFIFFHWEHFLYLPCIALLWIPNIVYRICPKCKFGNKKADLYCGKCGEKL